MLADPAGREEAPVQKEVDMDSLSLASLALQLLVSIDGLSGYPASQDLPEIRQMPLAQIQARFCSGPCRVQAYYQPGEGIFIDEAFDLANDEFARSVLLHELVHHVQRVSGKFQGIASECGRWVAAEREAYAIQNLYLEAIHAPQRVNLRTWWDWCDD